MRLAEDYLPLLELCISVFQLNRLAVEVRRNRLTVRRLLDFAHKKDGIFLQWGGGDGKGLVEGISL